MNQITNKNQITTKQELVDVLRTMHNQLAILTYHELNADLDSLSDACSGLREAINQLEDEIMFEEINENLGF
jgi:hypothetical protein